MDFLEKDLEQIIFETPTDTLKQRGYTVEGVRYRQLNIGKYGIADLVTFKRAPCLFGGSSNLIVTVHEFKKDQINISTFFQAIRYCKGISHFLSLRQCSIPFQFRISLCGRSIDKDSDFIYLTDLIAGDPDTEFDGRLCMIDFYTYRYLFDGIGFDRHFGYSLIDSGFKLKELKNSVFDLEF